MPLARTSVGLVENKLFQAKVEGALQKVEGLARVSKGPAAANLQRVSQSLALMRTSVTNMQRTSMGRVSAGSSKKGAVYDAESGQSSTAVIQQQMQQLEQVADEMPAEVSTCVSHDVLQLLLMMMMMMMVSPC